MLIAGFGEERLDVDALLVLDVGFAHDVQRHLVAIVKEFALAAKHHRLEEVFEHPLRPFEEDFADGFGGAAASVSGGGANQLEIVVEGVVGAAFGRASGLVAHDNVLGCGKESQRRGPLALGHVARHRLAFEDILKRDVVAR